MRITVNGATEPLAEGSTLGDLIAQYCPEQGGIAVAHNEIVVPRSHHATTVLVAGDVVEIVTAVQGG